MAQRIAGIAFLTVDGTQLALRGNFTVSPSPVERTMLAGQDGVHGYQELPRVPYIEGDISTMPGFYLEDLLTETDSTVVAQLANNMQYTLTGGTCKGGFENNTRDGQVRVRWEGVTCQEVSLA
jgi:Phage tail tube protein